jgi:hypothetical protein
MNGKLLRVLTALVALALVGSGFAAAATTADLGDFSTWTYQDGTAPSTSDTLTLTGFSAEGNALSENVTFDGNQHQFIVVNVTDYSTPNLNVQLGDSSKAAIGSNEDLQVGTNVIPMSNLTSLSDGDVFRVGVVAEGGEGTANVTDVRIVDADPTGEKTNIVRGETVFDSSDELNALFNVSNVENASVANGTLSFSGPSDFRSENLTFETAPTKLDLNVSSYSGDGTVPYEVQVMEWDSVGSQWVMGFTATNFDGSDVSLDVGFVDDPTLIRLDVKAYDGSGADISSFTFDGNVTADSDAQPAPESTEDGDDGSVVVGGDSGVTLDSTAIITGLVVALLLAAGGAVLARLD